MNKNSAVSTLVCADVLKQHDMYTCTYISLLCVSVVEWVEVVAVIMLISKSITIVHLFIYLQRHAFLLII